MISLFKDALMITGFVLVMMLIIEYLNVATAGRWRQKLAQRRWTQYLLVVLLGVLPGCLGAFTVVAMYTHGLVTLGAVVGAMIAVSGDEAFVMLAIIPRQALLLMLILAGAGLLVAVIVDLVGGPRKTQSITEGFELHEKEQCKCFEPSDIPKNWKDCTPARGVLAITLLIFLLGVIAGQLGPPEWNWVRFSLIGVGGIALFIVSTVPDHFIDEHLWRHVVLKHARPIFLWTLGALLVIYLVTKVFSLESVIHENAWLVLLIACAVGLIPESGPNIIFITLFAKGLTPFSVLLANSIVQDGHGMLPMLAHSRREFAIIKGINFLVALAIGSAGLLMGW